MFPPSPSLRPLNIRLHSHPRTLNPRTLQRKVPTDRLLSDPAFARTESPASFFSPDESAKQAMPPPSAPPRSSPPASSSPSRAQSSPNLVSSPPTSYVCASPDCPLPPPPPPAPLPWTWTCHCCGRRYSVAVTRRCLSCGHHFCLWHAGRCGDARVALYGGRSVCGIEFDYDGWRAWTEWRREVGRFRRRSSSSSRNHDCSIDCDYPSQCLHQRYMALRACAAAGHGPGGEQQEEDGVPPATMEFEQWA